LKIPNALVVLVLFASSAFAAAGPTTLNNDDSCDVIVTPAATLLLPYFEVDVANPAGENTLFTITNVTQAPQIARVTIWTDRSFPLFSFNIFLTGYDVQSISLFDVIARGRLAEPGTTSDSDVGRRSLDNDENPLLDIAACDYLTVIVPETILADLQAALVSGRAAGCSNTRVGGQHVNAVGYLTIDVVQSCGVTMPSDAEYFADELLYDNVLTGDYQQANSSQNFAQAGTMVHIRAIPEGGPPGVHATNFSRTFYSNLQNGGTGDRRQPLPSTFAARWIGGGADRFGTSFKIWREGIGVFGQDCAVTANGTLGMTEIVRFDEYENPVAFADCQFCIPLGPPTLPSSSRTRESDSLVFPPNPGANVAGWMYMNFDHDARFSFVLPTVASQNWVVVSMEAEGRYSADFDAASLGNGCSFPAVVTDKNGEAPAIGPAVDLVNAVFPSSSPKTLNNDDSCDIKVTPAATLLLPYFEVDLTNSGGETTLFTVTNVTALPRIARITIWTDWAFPVLTFNVFLTGYDVQSINLSDVIVRGRIAEPGTSSLTAVGRRSSDNDANPLLDVSSCGRLAVEVPPAILRDLQAALTIGRTSSCGTARVGAVHTNAIGYLTVDVVQNCESRLPIDPGYFRGDLLYDNALIGDYQQVSSVQNFAQANAMVHIRAIPEGGFTGSAATTFRRTFYSRLQAGGTADRRQPLPSTFAAHWISGGRGDFQTSFKIWREGTTGATAGCAVSANASPMVEIVRFDEAENPTIFTVGCPIPTCPNVPITFPSVSRVPSTSPLFPPNSTSDVAGWMYLNLDNKARQTPLDAASQNWVVVSMRAEGRYSGDFDATALGNGCSPPVGVTDEDPFTSPVTGPNIGPATNTNPVVGSQ
jgi:hypothetical protein